MIARHGLDALKSLGQHFLLDLNLTRRIVREAGDLSGASVIEIGPGPGGLTRALLESGAARVVAIERDRRAIGALAELSDARLHVVEADALEIDPAQLVPPPRHIVANLPYNIATALLVRWLKHADDYAAMMLMFQKEVADRLVARPRSKDYGRLSVLTQWACTAKAAFDIPARAFTPPPRVTSTVVRLVPRPDRENVPAEALERVTAAAFGQRRKMLRQSLKTLGIDPGPLLADAGIDPQARAEELDVAAFCRLASVIAGKDPPRHQDTT